MPRREAVPQGAKERVLSRDPDGPAVPTRLVRRLPGPDTGTVGVITHGCVEQVPLLEGDLVDLTLGRVFGPGHDESRRPGHASRSLSRPGCTLLGIRDRA